MDYKKYYVADFETTTEQFYNKFGYTRVWAWCCCNLENIEKSLKIGNNLGEFIKLFAKSNKICYFHNLKFDGQFIIDWLLNNNYKYSEKKEEQTFNTIIDNTGVFYQIEIIFKKYKGKSYKVKFLDSLKKIPLKVKSISKSFGISEIKGLIDYDKERPEGYVLTEEEKKYIINDCVIVAKALKQEMEQGLLKMTIGSDSLTDYKNIIGEKSFKYLFPTLNLELDKYMRSAYKGGFTYAFPARCGKIYKGISYDVNSLYPSILYGIFGALPYGMPKKFKGKYKNDPNYPLYIQEVVFMGKLKPKHLPSIQLKGMTRFLETEYLEVIDEPTTMRLCAPDLELMLENYSCDYIEYNGGYKFKGSTKLFKEFIEKWYSVKVEADKKGNEGLRTLAKLMLNNLYGKFGLNPLRENKTPYLNEEGCVAYKITKEEFIDPLFVPLAAYVTAYGRKQTIEAGNACYDRFLYADTDSIHIIYGDPPNIKISKTELGAWKNEGIFYGKFLHAKTYIKRKFDSEGNLKTEITCASMNDSIKNKLKSMPQAEAFKRFSVGEKFTGNLKQKLVKGGCILLSMPFEIR